MSTEHHMPLSKSTSTSTPIAPPSTTHRDKKTNTNTTLPSTNKAPITTTHTPPHKNLVAGNDNKNVKITLLPDPTPAHAPALRAWTSLFGAKTSRPHPDQPTFKQTYSYPNGRLLLASTPENPVAGLIAWRRYDGRFARLKELGFLGGRAAAAVDGDGGDSANGNGNGNGDGKRDVGIVVEVVRLFVAPELRNQGIATALVRALVALAREDGVGFMYLHTHPFLPGAERLWEKMGWRVLVREKEKPWFTIHMGRRV